MIDELIENEIPVDARHEKPYLYFGYRNGHPYLNIKESDDRRKANDRKLLREFVNPEQSILSQRKDPESYPEVTGLVKYSMVSVFTVSGHLDGVPRHDCHKEPI